MTECLPRSPRKNNSEERVDETLQQDESIPEFRLETIPCDEELKTLMESCPLSVADQEYEMGSVILPMSLNHFFKEFLSTVATYPFDAFCKEVQKNTDIVFTPIREMKDKKQGYPIYTRKLTCVIPITGVPFCSSSAMEKTMLIKRPSPGKMTWEMVTNVFDVPYGDHFEHHETWTLLSTSDTAVKTILRAADKL